MDNIISIIAISININLTFFLIDWIIISDRLKNLCKNHIAKGNNAVIKSGENSDTSLTFLSTMLQKIEKGKNKNFIEKHFKLWCFIIFFTNILLICLACFFKKQFNKYATEQWMSLLVEVPLLLSVSFFCHLLYKNNEKEKKINERAKEIKDNYNPNINNIKNQIPK